MNTTDTDPLTYILSLHKKPKRAAAGPMFWWIVNSLPMTVVAVQHDGAVCQRLDLDHIGGHSKGRPEGNDTSRARGHGPTRSVNT